MANIVVQVPPAPIWDYGTPESPMFMLPGNQEYPGVRYYIASGETYTGNAATPGTTATVWYRTDAGYEFPDGTTEVTFVHSYEIVVSSVITPTYGDLPDYHNSFYINGIVTGVQYRLFWENYSYTEVIQGGNSSPSVINGEPAGRFTITAEAKPGYVIAAGVVTFWEHTWHKPLGMLLNTPLPQDASATQQSMYYIPSAAESESGHYEVNGMALATGWYPIDTSAGPATVTVNFVLTNGWTTTQSTSWTLTINPYSATPPTATVVYPEAPYFWDGNGTAEDFIRIHESTGVQYFVNDSTTPSTAGLYYLTGLVKVEAKALDGYVLASDAVAIWQQTLSSVMVNYASTSDVTFSDVNGTYTIPSDAGVDYFVNGSATAAPAGTYPMTANVVVEARAQAGYTMNEYSTLFWSHQLNASVTQEITPAAVQFFDRLNTGGVVKNIFRVPSQQGVFYAIGQIAIAAADYDAAEFMDLNGQISIDTHLDHGYTYASGAQASFVHTFPPVLLVATQPTWRDVATGGDNTYTIPYVPHLTYKVNGAIKAVGTYPASGFITVTVEASKGYAVDGNAGWSHLFIPAPVPKATVVPAGVLFTDLAGTSNDEYVIPSTTGVRYSVDNHWVDAGTYKGSGYVYVIAVAEEGYELVPGVQNQWVFTFGVGAPDYAPFENAGSAPTNLTFKVSGVIQGFTITERRTGRRIVFSQYTSATDVVVIDSATGDITINGYAPTAYPLTLQEWTPVYPGQTNEYSISVPSGASAQLTISGRSAWL